MVLFGGAFLAYKDSAIYKLSFQIAYGSPEWYLIRISNDARSQVSVGVAKAAWVDGLIGNMVSIEGLMADYLGVPRGTLNPAWIPDVPAPPSVGGYEATSMPSGAELWVDGLSSGLFTPVSAAVSVGSHVFMAVKAGYDPLSKTVIIVADPITKISFTLVPIILERTPWEQAIDYLKLMFTSDALMTTEETLDAAGVTNATARTLLSLFIPSEFKRDPDTQELYWQTGMTMFVPQFAATQGLAGAAIEGELGEITKANAQKILTKIVSNPTAFKLAMGKMSEPELQAFFERMSASPTGRIAIAQVMKAVAPAFATKGAAAVGFSSVIKGISTAAAWLFGFIFLGKFVLFDIPAYTANLRKEIPEASAMAVWASIENAQQANTRAAWVLAQISNEIYKNFIDVTDESTAGWVSLNPWLKDVYLSSSDAQRTQYDSYKAIIDAKIYAFDHPEKGTLEVVCNVESADVYIDGLKKGLTPLTYQLVPGTYHVLVTKFQHTSDEKDVTVEAAKSVGASFNITSTVTPPPPPPPPPGETKWCQLEGQYIPLEEWSSSRCVPVVPPTPPTPEEEIIIPLEPSDGRVVYNAWKYTIRAVDANTGEELYAGILIDDVYMDKYTPNYFYLWPEASYNIKIRKRGYKQGEIIIDTPALPT